MRFQIFIGIRPECNLVSNFETCAHFHTKKSSVLPTESAAHDGKYFIAEIKQQQTSYLQNFCQQLCDGAKYAAFREKS